MKTLERITSSEVRQWKSLTGRLCPGKAYIVENHGQPEAVILHPDDLSIETDDQDLSKHFAAVKARPAMPMPSFDRSSEL